MPRTTILVSIPNGMEFYDVVWRRRLFNTYVSIPNGMEFYYIMVSHYDFISVVSIPNGMEFYAESSDFEAHKTCFNSQRDGILLSLSLWDLKFVFVSIPNGMEFYYAPILSWRKIPSFNSQGIDYPPNLLS